MSKLPKLLDDVFRKLKRQLWETGAPPAMTISVVRLGNGTVQEKLARFSAPYHLEQKNVFVMDLCIKIWKQNVSEIALLYEAWVKILPRDDPGTEIAMERVKDYGVREESDKEERWVLQYENKQGENRIWWCPIDRTTPNRVVLGSPEEISIEWSAASRFFHFYKKVEEIKRWWDTMQRMDMPPESN